MNGEGAPVAGADPLAAAAAALDAEAKLVEQGAAAPGAPAPPVDRAAEAAELVEFASTLLFPLWPTLEKVYTPAVRARLAGATVPLMVKYDFSLADLFKTWAPEIGFAMVAGPLIAPTVQAIRADRAAKKAAAAVAVDAKPPPAAEGAAMAPPPAAAAVAADLLARAAASSPS